LHLQLKPQPTVSGRVETGIQGIQSAHTNAGRSKTQGQTAVLVAKTVTLSSSHFHRLRELENQERNPDPPLKRQEPDTVGCCRLMIKERTYSYCSMLANLVCRPSFVLSIPVVCSSFCNIKNAPTMCLNGLANRVSPFSAEVNITLAHCPKSWLDRRQISCLGTAELAFE
jgi:hypothetical protein